MIVGRRAQDTTGPLQKLMLSLFLVSVVAILGFSFVADLGSEYDVVVTDNSSFTSFNQYTSTLNRTEEIRNVVSDVSTGETNILVAMVTGGYNVLSLFVKDIPSDFNNMINTATDILGLPAAVAGFLYAVVLVIALFAVIGLILKLRA